METSRPRMHITSPAIAVTIVLLAALGLATSALGATIKQASNCEAFEKSGEAHESAVDALSFRPVDHAPLEHVAANRLYSDGLRSKPMNSESANAELAPLDTELADTDSATPFLYLTPRVASALRDIFETVRGSVDSTTNAQDESAIASSPLAEVDKKVTDESLFLELSPHSTIDREVDLPPLQRQMFRTDI